MPQGKLSLSLLLDQKTTLSTRNTIGIDPLRIDGSIEVKSVVLNQYAPYYQDQVLFNIEEGSLDLSTSYQYSKTDKDTITKLSGLSLALKSLRLKKKEEPEEFLNIPLLTVQNTGVDLNQKTVTVGEVSTQKGSIFVQRFKGGKLNLQSLFPEPAKKEEKQEKKEEKPAQERAEQAEKPWLVKVGKVSLDQYRVGCQRPDA